MKQQFLIESNSIFHHSNYSKYLKHKIYDFFLFNIIIFISLFSSFFSDETKIWKIKIVIAQNNESGGDMHIINEHWYDGVNKRKCPSIICENNTCKNNSCNINLSKGSHSITVEWYSSDSFTDCSYMFHAITAINEIDFSEFCADNIQYMACMFKGCTSLQKIILPNIEIKFYFLINIFLSKCFSLSILLYLLSLKMVLKQKKFKICNQCS